MNKSNNRALFLVHTEHVFLVSLLYYKIYLEVKNIDPIFILLMSNNNRFRFINVCNNNFTIKKIKNDLNSRKIFPDLNFFKMLKFNGIYELVFQNPDSFITEIIVQYYKFKNPKLKLTLISDTIAIDRELSIRQIIKNNLKLYYRKIFNEISYLPSKVWTYENLFIKVNQFIAYRNTKYKNFINVYDLLLKSVEYNKLIMKIFYIDLNLYKGADIIFFTQPISHHRSISKFYKNKYFSVLDYLSKESKKYKKKLTIKVHPSENPNDYFKYKNEYVYVDKNNTLPAELIINSIEEKIVASMWSSVSTLDLLRKNKHFWLYKVISYPLNISLKYDGINYIQSLNQITSLFFKI